MDLIAGEVLWGRAWWAAGNAEEAFESGGSQGPEQEQFMIVIYEAMPGIAGDEECGARFDRRRDVVEQEYAAAAEDVEGFVGLQMTVNGDTRASGDLLGAHGEVGRARSETEFDEEVAAIAKVDEVFASVAGEDTAARGCLLLGGAELSGSGGESSGAGGAEKIAASVTWELGHGKPSLGIFYDGR